MKGDSNMIRKIIQIDENKCNGCGACAAACHEGAIGMVDGIARLLKDDYCDGLGDCLPACPADAISLIEREAAAYDMKAVLERQHEKAGISLNSQLRQWPVQIKLVPVVAPYFNGADLLIAADCTAYAYSRFHEDFIKNHVTVIGCTKLDSTDYSQKFADFPAKHSTQCYCSPHGSPLLWRDGTCCKNSNSSLW